MLCRYNFILRKTKEIFFAACEFIPGGEKSALYLYATNPSIDRYVEGGNRRRARRCIFQEAEVLDCSGRTAIKKMMTDAGMCQRFIRGDEMKQLFLRGQVCGFVEEDWKTV